VEEHKAATKLQAAWRRKTATSYVAKVSEAAEVDRASKEKLDRAILIMQKCVRGFLARRPEVTELARLHKVCTTFQRAWRKKTGRPIPEPPQKRRPLAEILSLLEQEEDDDDAEAPAPEPAPEPPEELADADAAPAEAPAEDAPPPMEATASSEKDEETAVPSTARAEVTTPKFKAYAPPAGDDGDDAASDDDDVFFPHFGAFD